MSRRIDTGTAEPAEEGKKPLYLGKKKGGDDYLGRLAGYIPAEIVGLYLATSAEIPRGANGARSQTALWIIFALCFVLVPVYFLFATTRDKKKALWPQVILASIAFPIWIFAIGGPFEHLSWYEGWIASATNSS